ncbi:MAG TPA: gliding motility-associated C-terminal domain-containing protein, partial [Bacteroidia bacterium]|nr:gliding motility-associated C-terminal domain-containing protein [Bacteroidia bacterium]
SIFLQKQYRKIQGTYKDTLITSQGCDSVITTNLQIGGFLNNTVAVTICLGDSIFLQNQYHKVSGTYKDTFATSKGCDSILTTILQVGSFLGFTVDTTICSGDSIFLQNQYRSTAGSYQDTIASASGCDSIVTTMLQVVNDYINTTDTSVCEGDSILRFGNYYKLQGSYYDTLSSTGNCKTIEITNLSLIGRKQELLSSILCESDSLFFGEKYLKTTGLYYDTTYNGNCIDTLRILTLTVKPISVFTAEFKVCPGDSVFYLGQFFTQDTIFYDTLENSALCDSIVVTRISEVGVPPVLADSAYYCENKLAEADPGEYYSYLWNNGSTNRILNTDVEGIYSVQVTDTNNCKFTDSIIITERCDPLIFVPTAFSPNNDGLNDIFKIESYNITELKFIIFDRWGEILFESDKIAFTWDGTYKGIALPIGVYHWSATFKGVNRVGRLLKMNQKGVLNLIR